jgi:serine protein kinase
MPEQVEQAENTNAQEHPREGAALDCLGDLSALSKGRFELRRQILSFREYFAEVAKAPLTHTRDAAHYVRDCFDHYGTREVPGLGAPIRRFKLFDAPFDGGSSRVLGQEPLQNEVYRLLSSFCEKGRVDKLLMIHGPNGTAKSTFVECLIGALRKYSLLPGGALYRFNWVFSDNAHRTGLGFGDTPTGLDEDGSLAHLSADEVTFKVGDELKDHPLLLVPKADRKELLDTLFKAAGVAPRYPVFLARGDLCAKNKAIYQALLNAHKGDWERIIQHVQVERIEISQRYRQCAVVIQPQRNVDANTRPLNLEKSYRLPPILNQSSLSELSGDLIDGNRGVIEYSDFFKRPLELSKYLLTTSEKGTISLPDTTAYIDCVLFATANEKNLTLFKRNPDFPSFKARFELLRAPYLLRWSDEEPIYAKRIPAIAENKHVAPHLTRIVALWAVLTRLRRPVAKHFSSELGALVSRLKPMEKAMLYDSGATPPGWADTDRKLLRGSVAAIASEYDLVEEEFEGLVDASYEGRRGASPREIVVILHQAAKDPDMACLSPLAVLKAIRKMSGDRSLYEFLRLPSEAGYGDVERLTDSVEGEYRRLVRDEVHRAVALVEEDAHVTLFHDYFKHAKASDGGEKILSSITKRLEDPDIRLLEKVEGLLKFDGDAAEYRKNLIVRIAAWVIDNPGQPVAYDEIFADILNALRENFYREREAAIEQIQTQILRHGTEDWAIVDAADQQRVIDTLDRLKSYGYCDRCAKEALNYVLQHKSSDG